MVNKSSQKFSAQSRIFIRCSDEVMKHFSLRKGIFFICFLYWTTQNFGSSSLQKHFLTFNDQGKTFKNLYFQNYCNTNQHNSIDNVTWCPTETIDIRLILFPVFELTVASHQRVTVKKVCRSQGRPDIYTWWPHSGRLTREGWSQTIGWDPKAEVGTPSRQRK